MTSSAASTSSIGPDEDPLGRRESLGVGVLAAVVDDPDVEIDLGRQAGHGLPDVPRADDHQPDPGQRSGSRPRPPCTSGLRPVGQRHDLRGQRLGTGPSGQLAWQTPSGPKRNLRPTGSRPRPRAARD